MHPIFIQCSQQSEFQHLQKMRLADTESHFCYLRMSKEMFDLLLAKVKTLFRQCNVILTHFVL